MIQERYPLHKIIFDVALAVWYGGVGPGVLGAVVAWAGAAIFVVAQHESLDMTQHEAWVQWAVSLGVALAIIWVALVLRRERVRAAAAEGVAEESVAGLENLQRLSSSLSAAASVSEVVLAACDDALVLFHHSIPTRHPCCCTCAPGPRSSPT